VAVLGTLYCSQQTELQYEDMTITFRLTNRW
jgi:hypothetical protein